MTKFLVCLGVAATGVAATLFGFGHAWTAVPIGFGLMLTASHLSEIWGARCDHNALPLSASR
jgi:hypothetical protein